MIIEDSIGGLEIENDSKWYPVQPRPDCLLVNTGELMSFATKGTIKTVRHRVKLPNETEKVRYSAPFFLEPCYDMVMKPIDTFSNEYIHRTPDHLQESISTEPITFESYLISRLKLCYNENDLPFSNSADH